MIHQKNGGPGAARNAGLSAALGEVITFVDPDDWVGDHYVSHKKTKFAAIERAQLYSAAGLTSDDDVCELAKQCVYDVFKCVPNMYWP